MTDPTYAERCARYQAHLEDGDAYHVEPKGGWSGWRIQSKQFAGTNTIALNPTTDTVEVMKLLWNTCNFLVCRTGLIVFHHADLPDIYAADEYGDTAAQAKAAFDAAMERWEGEHTDDAE